MVVDPYRDEAFTAIAGSGVTNGVAVRMALLYLLSGRTEAPGEARA